MIKRLRREFILVIMAVVAVLMLVAFFAVLISTSSNLGHDSRFALNDALSKMDGPAMHGGKPGGPGDRPMPNITVTTDAAGTVVSFNNQIFNFDDSEIPTVTRLALESSKTSGILRSYNLRYMTHKASDGTARLAFIDNSMETRVMKNLLINSAVIGISTLLLFLAVSILLSHWVVKPVEKAWNSQRQFIADASHELKTPLTVILSNSAMLSEEPSNADEKTRARLGNILAEAKRMKVLVDDLLSLARSDDARGKPVFERVSLSDVLQNAVLSFEPVIFDMGRKFDYTVAGDIFVTGDASRLRQLVEILLDNACKYSTPGSGITAVLKTTARGEACFEIANDSDTIPKDELPKIFERFYRLDKSRSSAGYGLGLSIAYTVVREHNGRIWASSESGRTVFSVMLPMAR